MLFRSSAADATLPIPSRRFPFTAVAMKLLSLGLFAVASVSATPLNTFKPHNGDFAIPIVRRSTSSPTTEDFLAGQMARVHSVYGAPDLQKRAVAGLVSLASSEAKRPRR